MGHFEIPPPKIPAISRKLLQVWEGFSLSRGIQRVLEVRRALRLNINCRIRERVPGRGRSFLNILQSRDLQGLFLDFIQDLVYWRVLGPF